MKTTHFNDSLNSNEVVVSVEETYTDNNGPQDYAYVWDGEKCTKRLYKSGYTNYHTIDINASAQQIKDAAENWAANPDNFKNDMSDYFEAIVILQRSRKAKNKIPLEVLNYRPGYFDRRYNNYISDSVLVNCPDNGPSWVSASCVKQIVRISLPRWT